MTNKHKDHHGAVYVIRDAATMRAYVGQTTMKPPIERLWQHWNSAEYRSTKSRFQGYYREHNGLHRYRIHGDWAENAYWKFEVVAYAYSQEELDALEAFHIEKERATDPEFGYNTKKGTREDKSVIPVKLWAGVQLTEWDLEEAAYEDVSPSSPLAGTQTRGNSP